MKILNMFLPSTLHEFENRISALTPDSKPLWGKMTVSQMFAHCTVNFEIILDKKISKQSWWKILYLQFCVKPIVLQKKPFPKNMKTRHHFFVIKGERDFEIEKNRLINQLYQFQRLGEIHFSDRNHVNLGKMSLEDWNLMLFKHLDHHLRQFGV